MTKIMYFVESQNSSNENIYELMLERDSGKMVKIVMPKASAWLNLQVWIELRNLCNDVISRLVR